MLKCLPFEFKVDKYYTRQLASVKRSHINGVSILHTDPLLRFVVLINDIGKISLWEIHILREKMMVFSDAGYFIIT